MGAAKAAMESLVRYLAVDLGPENIQVNAISAGPIKGDLLAAYPDSERLIPYWESRTPSGRLGVAEDIIAPMMFLLSPASTSITGAVVAVEGGGALKL
jgi:enoyl-[acyl-carrier-protein] reductase (NADH)